ncbi:Por secretion system C-terminal sorting domain-containing protein [Hymenobacter daecheongensis DSM 21074]|uniref:Por secretion system C-terminal sorting domain-containing protein n=1 Tax=Hymenobacter daecheongensis DSM 21074 TaxID=1121955 RepID=A0A1M6FAE6_9BACT|nr:T9SS type A sorting domain-containing protein [Hymenobacter daecheongensis]SHI94626.1 Por secretion system C-terminal sorting domain-containing protein [Hymenobacter daecheongensis DSM 21074]
MICLKSLRKPLFIFSLLLPLAGRAQLVQPLPTDPGRAAALAAQPNAASRPAALALPFFDDFSLQREGPPNNARWVAGGGVLVNNRFALAPPSRGVASFDGLNGRGQPYGTLYSDTDTLTSQPIDLSTLTATDRVFLSFFYQVGNIYSQPSTNSSSRPVFIEVQFKDNNGRWQQVWVLRSQGRRTDFRQKLLAVDQARYLHANFQFRFHTSGYQSTANGNDSWSVDYVKLDRNRSAADSSYRDIATSTPLTSLLKRFTAMPVWQYNANPTPANELNDQTQTTINNLDIGPQPIPIDWRGTVQVLPAGPVVPFRTVSQGINASARQVVLSGSVRNAPIPVTPAEKTIRHTIALVPLAGVDPLTVPNDSISRVTELRNFYAYDDGSPEGTIDFFPFTSGPPHFYALRYDLNANDQVRSLRIYPILPEAAGRTITANVWDSQGQGTDLRPTDTPKASQSFVIPATLPAGQRFLEINFAAPVPVSGTFFVGYGRGPIGGQYAPMGLDLNNAPPTDYFFANETGQWKTYTTDQFSAGKTPAGAIMMRPVMTNNQTTTASADPTVAAAFSLYPNPSTGRVRVQGHYARAAVLDALGRPVWAQPAAQLGQPELDLRPLAAGVYLVQLTLPTGLTVTKRLVLAR